MKTSLTRILSLVLALCLCLTMLPAVRISVAAASKTLSSAEIVNYLIGRVGASYPSGYCLAFVADSFEALGATRSSACCAYTYGNTHIVSTDINSIPIGADVFFENCGGATTSSHRSRNGCSAQYYGHIGIYVGNGYFVHATGGKVQKTALSSSYWSTRFRGWGYHGNVSLSEGLAHSTHTYTGSYYDSAHPHNEYQVCSCGAKQYTGGSRFVTGCSACALVAATPLPAWSFLQGKAIVVMAPSKITISSKQYISAHDLCIVRGFDAATGQCEVTYPSGGTDVFHSTQRKVTLNLSSMLSYDANFETQHLNATKSYTVYPTSEMKQLGTNWILDPGDEFYTVNRVGNATEVLYYCNRGAHAGYWKLGWIYLDYAFLDLNGTINGQYSGGLDGFGTVDFILNGESYGKNIADFYKEVPVGSTYRIENVRGNNAVYKGVSEGSLEGTVSGTTNVVLAFNRIYHMKISHYAGDFKYGEGNNAAKDNLLMKTVTYDVEYGSSVALDATKLVPVPDGMEFAYISTAAVDGTWKSHSLGVTAKQGGSDITVEYHYKAIDYKISYQLNGGTNSKDNPATYNVFYGVTLQAPTRAGYTFTGWTDEEGNPVTGINQGANMSFATANGYDAMFAKLGERTIGDITLTANWTKATVSSISVASTPQKTTYFKGETLNTAGLALTVTYSDGSKETVTSGFTCSPTTLNTVGKQTITVSYGGKTTSFNVTVSEVTLTELKVKTNPAKIQYFVGDVLDTTGLTLTATYSDGSTKTISEGFTCTPTELTSVGTQTITVSYGGKTTTFSVTVSEVTLTKISMKKHPKKSTYYVGDAFDPTGIELTATYSDGSTKVITEGFTYTPGTLTTAGTQIVSVFYGGQAAFFSVTVLERPAGTMSVSQVSGKPGETVTVAVIIDSNPGIIAARLEIAYNSDVLTLTEVRDGGILGEYVFGGSLSANPYIVTWENGLAASDYTTTGTLVYLTFKIAENAPAGDFPVTVSYDPEEIYNKDLSDVSFTVTQGSVTVEESVEIDPSAPQLVVEKATAVAGDTVTVTLDLSNSPSFGGMAYDVYFDTNMLELVSYELNLGSAICTDSGIDTYPGRINFQYASTENVSGDGTLVTFTFKVKEDVKTGFTPITVIPEEGTSFYYDGRKEIDFDLFAVDGGIEIIDYMKGDINGDGKVNNRDAARLMQYLAGWDVDYVEAALDVNGDGKVNNRDAARLMQYLAGWEVEIH